MTDTKQSKPIVVTTHRVSCDGGGGVQGHPKVYMDFVQDTLVSCKYCGQEFTLKH